MSGALAQVNNAVVPFYREYFLNQNSVNPSIIQEEPVFANVQHKSYFGPLSVINTFTGNFNYNFNKNSGMGLQFHSEQEGKFFNRDRFMISYTSNVMLTEKVRLGAGARIGFVNYSFGASTGSAGGSSIKQELGVGLSIQSPVLLIAASGSQLTEPELRPVNVAFKVPRTGELLVQHVKGFGHTIKYFPYVRYRFTHQYGNNTFMHSHIFSPENNRWHLGVHHLWGLGVSPTFGFNKSLNNDEMILGLTFSYFVSMTSSVRTNQLVNQYEIGISFRKK